MQHVRLLIVMRRKNDITNNMFEGLYTMLTSTEDYASWLGILDDPDHLLPL